MTTPISNVPEPGASGTPGTPSDTPPTTPPTWRAGEGAPEWARGKTAEEVLSLGEQMYGMLQQFNQQGVVQRAAQPSAPDPAPSPGFRDDDYVMGAQVRDFAQQFANQSILPQLQATQRLAAQTNLAMVKREHADVFQKYGPEVETYLAGVPVDQWTLPTLEKVVKFVKSEHFDELLESKAREKAQQLLQEAGPSGLRPSGAPGGGPSHQHNTQKFTLSDPDLPAPWRDRAEKAGLTELQIDSYCRATGTSREDFFKGLANGSIAASPKGR